MSAEDPSFPFTEREEEGEFLISIGITVHQDAIHVSYSTSEHHADFSLDNFVGMQLAEAYSHPALVARFIEQTIGDGEVKCHFIRRSDELSALINWECDESEQPGRVA